MEWTWRVNKQSNRWRPMWDRARKGFQFQIEDDEEEEEDEGFFEGLEGWERPAEREREEEEEEEGRERRWGLGSRERALLRASISWRNRASPAAAPAVPEDAFFPGSGFPSMVAGFLVCFPGLTRRKRSYIVVKSGYEGAWLSGLVF